MMKIFTYMFGALVLSVGTALSANAAPILFCSNGSIDLVNDGCISGSASGYLNGGDGIYSNSGGGDPEADVEAAILAATGASVDISLYGKSDNDNSASLFAFTGSVPTATDEVGGQSGDWDVLDNAIEVAYITIKAANSFALFDVQGSNSGTWNTEGILNNGGSQPGVSHISFWTVGGTTNVPEPGTFVLLSMGMLGLGLSRRKKR
ncbi:MAG: PEP-CTERM sorting domain-containing protein [Oceanicoccus sp.]